MEEASKQTAEASRSIMERKAEIYNKLKKGQTGGLSNAQVDALLVDVRISLLGYVFTGGSHSMAVRCETA